MSLLSKRPRPKWVLKPEIYELAREDEDRNCPYCNRVCVPKNIGFVCWHCIEGVPSHIPIVQIEKYLMDILRKEEEWKKNI